jgi:tRNA(His) guanylyltransferase
MYVQGTNSAQKHEIMFSRFKINYNNLPERFRKGSIVLREDIDPDVQTPVMKKASKAKTKVVVLHCDLIGDQFWQERLGILS